IKGDEGAIELTEAEGCWWTPETHALERIKAVAAAQTEMEERRAAEAAGEAQEQKPEAEKTADMVTSGGSRYASPTIAPAQRLVAPGSDITSDKHQFRAFTHHIKNGGLPRTNQMIGLGDTIVAWSAFKAI